MRILATADLHGRLPEVEPCEVLILAGDICPDFPNKAGKYLLEDKGAYEQAEWLDTTFRDWVTRIADRGTIVLATWGNHDFVGETKLVPTLPWLVLVDEGFVIGGISFYGSPWVPGLKRWAFYGSDNALEARAESLITPQADLLILHGPPYGYGDDGLGDTYLANMLDNERVAPKFLVCGHIHEARGTYRHPKGPVILNVAYLDDNYENPVPPTEILIGRPPEAVWA